MNSLIVYYSYTGNTEKVAKVLAGVLEEKGEVQAVRLRALDESKSFFGQCIRGFFKKRAEIEEAPYDLKQYDLICLGTPLWAFGPTPSMWTYLDKITGIEGKKAVIFTTYGSGTGNNRCLDLMEGVLKKKGAAQVNRFSIQQFKVTNRDFILNQLASIGIPYFLQGRG